MVQQIGFFALLSPWEILGNTLINFGHQVHYGAVQKWRHQGREGGRSTQQKLFQISNSIGDRGGGKEEGREGGVQMVIFAVTSFLNGSYALKYCLGCGYFQKLISKEKVFGRKLQPNSLSSVYYDPPFVALSQEKLSETHLFSVCLSRLAFWRSLGGGQPYNPLQVFRTRCCLL